MTTRRFQPVTNTTTVLTKFGLALCCLILGGCTATSNSGFIREVTILYTNDEHGWMEGMEEGQGAANIYSLWESQENYKPDGAFLILSGGDNWTGPAISTWTEGKSMVEVMNAMNYDATAVGNHEFDFGLEVMQQRISESDFPYLSANTRWRQNDTVPQDLGILPYSIQTVNDVTFGIIGLTTRSTPFATNPNIVADLDFIDYEQALRETIPSVNAANVDLLIVVAHVCVSELQALIENTQDLEITMMGAGHCNELTAQRVNDTILLGGGYHFTAYAKAKLTYDISEKTLLDSSISANEYRNSASNGAIQNIIAGWSAQTEEILSEPVAFLANSLSRRSEAMEQAIVNSWLEADPSADVVITNAGGIRIDLPAGPIDVGDVVAVMPFDNTIIALNVSGAVIRDALANGSRPVLGGLDRQGSDWIVRRTGQVLADNQQYRLLVNSFMYAGGDGYTMLPEADPDGFDTGINYRQPFQDWLQIQNSNSASPLRF